MRLLKKRISTVISKCFCLARWQGFDAYVENSGDFIGTFRENVIRVIGNYSTQGIATEYDAQIEELQMQMLKLIEDNAKQGAVSDNFDNTYKHISEQINELKKAKIRLVQEQK